MALSIEHMAVFCKKKGFVYPTGEIYGGMAGFFDYGHLGVELKNNIKAAWWKFHVQQREDVVGIDGAIITNPKVWAASGHVACFEDVMVECVKCRSRFRGDHLLENALKISAEGLKKEDITKLIQENAVACPECKGKLADAKQFNLMFSTAVGPTASKDSAAYLRPETAQLIFTNFRLVQENARMKLPFGIAQMGKAFRNEISPRDFLFRCREFEQMELEYFVHPKKADDCPYIKDVLSHSLNVYSADMQKKKQGHKEMTIKELISKKIITTQWHAYWLAAEHQWFIGLGADQSKFRIRQHLPEEKSHYAEETWDLEYEFPFGWKELQGMANRADFDFRQHMEHSKKDLSVFDEESKSKVIPYVIAEPSQGVDRAFLVFLFDAYTDDKERGNVILKLHPQLAPVKAAVFPLLGNNEELTGIARKIYLDLRKHFAADYDKSGSIGRRYARNDEIGTPYCITVDFDSITGKDATIRDRDSTGQKRVKIDALAGTLKKLLNSELSFKDI